MYSYAYALKPLNFLNLYNDIKILVNQKPQKPSKPATQLKPSIAPKRQPNLTRA
jgi:hypothetical protein